MSKKTDTTFKEVANLWFDFEKISVKASTLSTYYNILHNHIIPCIGNIAISKIDKNTIDKLIISLHNSGRLDKKGGLSAKTITDISSVIISIVKFACDNKYIRYGSFSIVKPKQEMKEIEVLTEQEQARIERYIRQNLNYKTAGILICLYTGIRIGELCALTISDIDFSNNTLKVNKSVQRIKNLDVNAKTKTKITIGSPKSSKARYIPIPSSISALIAPLYKECQSNHYIITGTAKHTEPRAYTNIFKKCLQDSGVRDINFHALRHTFATRCIEADFDVKTLSEILGHADVKITLNTYVHSSFKLKCKQMEKLQLLCG